MFIRIAQEPRERASKFREPRVCCRRTIVVTITIMMSGRGVLTGKFSPLISSFCFLLALAALQVKQAAAQTHASTPAPPSPLTRPDSIQDSGFYNYWAGMSAQGRAGGVLLGKVAMEGEPLPCPRSPVRPQ